MNLEQCAAQHFGYWLIQSRWITAAVAAFNAGTLPRITARVPEQDAKPLPAYAVDETGVAYVEINGAITKGLSSFGGTSSVMTQRALRLAERDPDVKGIMLMIDSPGGTVDGIDALAQDVAAIAKRGIKPIATHADGLMDSAALWAGVQAPRVTASRMTEIGSIGTVASVTDYSGAAEKEGVKVHVISTGPMKGAFTPGTEITEDQLAWLQERVNAVNQFFLEAVKTGRKMSMAKVQALATGEDWMAADAKERGLIDEVMTRDDAVQSFRKVIKASEQGRNASARQRSRAEQIARLGG